MISLFVNFYLDSNRERQQEINECLMRNLRNPAVDRIVAVCNREDDLTGFDGNSKLEQVVHAGKTHRIAQGGAPRLLFYADPEPCMHERADDP